VERVEAQPDESQDWREVATTRLREKFGVSAKHIRQTRIEVGDAARSALLADLMSAPATQNSPIEQLANALGWTPKKLYRHLHLMPGVEKLDPTKKKSHFHIPDPAGSARRWNAGERRSS
jgi:hypothetical protein